MFRASILFRRTCGAHGRKAAGQQHIIQHGEMRNKIELLKYQADCVAAKGISGESWQGVHTNSVDAYTAGSWLQYSRNEAEQGAFAPAAGAGKKDRLPFVHAEQGDTQGFFLLAGPAKDAVFKQDCLLARIHAARRLRRCWRNGIHGIYHLRVWACSFSSAACCPVGLTICTRSSCRAGHAEKRRTSTPCRASGCAHSKVKDASRSA